MSPARTLRSVIEDGYAELRCRTPLHGCERAEIAESDLEALLSWCARQCRLLSRTAEDYGASPAAIALLEGGPGEDGAEANILAAMQCVQSARLMIEREAA